MRNRSGRSPAGELGRWLGTAAIAWLLQGASGACTLPRPRAAGAGTAANASGNGAAAGARAQAAAGNSPLGTAAAASGGNDATASAPDAGRNVIIDASALGMPDTGPARGPEPPQAGVRFPFPQNRESSRCSYPTSYRNEDLQAAYARWKRDTVTADGALGHLRVKRPHEPGLEPDSTVSEGIGYGMLNAVYMNDQMLFDELWKYERMWLDDNGLMDWYINAAGTDRLGTGAATDADEDMAFALVMADRQWGGNGTLDMSYLDYARDQVKRFWDHDIYDSKLARAGDHWGDWNNVNISYFAPAYYRVFQKLDGNQAGWDAVLKTVYDTIDNALNAQNGNQQNGLVPAWCTSMGVPGNPGNYQYDACRTPFRIALDYCWFGEPRAQAYVAKTTGFFAAIGAAGIVDGYDLNGAPHAANPGNKSAAFLGPAAVGAMAIDGRRAFIDQSYSLLVGDDVLAGGTYYEESWQVLALMMLTGNFLDYTQY